MSLKLRGVIAELMQRHMVELISAISLSHAAAIDIILQLFLTYTHARGRHKVLADYIMLITRQ